ncbi:unnamed protein product [Kluyveromyces dobzhanskii CBS 2104]|uniref:WGS project CCBQ000000000 data, contig 00102 n=1 Tax=Kluyveromyces dobzhanskii CBS 2104 TaxID=1427455 RepID=A0A0A8L6K1_9SACH|nr:unnamed protein product [Kluyveromyces dobzhanskii CBS 2104]
MQISVNDRLNIGGEYCTVRFIGSLPAWPNNVAYGLEWDNVERGKHNGSLNGVRYFETSNGENAGSFMKDDKLTKHELERFSFEEALLMRYGDTSSTDIDYKSGFKETKSYGFEHLNQLNSDLGKLGSIILSRNNISRAFKATYTDREGSLLNDSNHSLQYLDLSFNLFSDINEIYHILAKFPAVKTLILSGNHFQNQTSELEGLSKFPSVEVLSLACCKINNSSFESIVKAFPGLKVLDVSSNLLSQLAQVGSTLEEINLSDNRFTELPTVLSEESALTYFDISENKISSIAGPWSNTRLKTFSIGRNSITNWEEVDNSQEDFYSIIARVKSVKCVDGTNITEDIRNEAELYFISSVLSSHVNYNVQGQEWKRLTQKHKIDTHIKTAIVDIGFLSKELIEIPIIYNCNETKMKMLKSFTVRYLKTLLRHKFNLQGEFTLQYSVMDNIKHDFTNEFSPISMYNIEESTIFIDTG